MKKNLLILAIIFLVSMESALCQNRSISFLHQPWPEILALAKKEKKLIFLDAYAAWCSPCKWMAANMFTNDSIADYFNRNFICAKIDMEQGEGVALAEKYAVHNYPTLLFIDSTGNMIHKRVGAARKVEEYISMATEAMDPEKNLAYMTKKHQSGDRDPEFIYGYCVLLQQAYIPLSSVLNDYFLKVNPEEMTSRPNWRLIFTFSDDMNSPEFLFLVKNQTKFEKRYTSDSVTLKINQVFYSALQNLMRSRTFTEEAYKATKEKIKASGYMGAEKILFTSDLNYYLGKGQVAAFLDLAYNNVDKNFSNDPGMLGELAMLVSARTADMKYLEKAGQWAKRSVELKSGAENNDIYAGILIKLGRKDEAKKHEQTAISLARKQGKPTQKYEDALKKMQE